MTNVYVWSRPIGNDIVNYQGREYRLWFHRVFPVHTFVTTENPWTTPPPFEKGQSGYWYCAGDFHPTDDSAVNEPFVVDINIDSAYCLVAPDIDRDNPMHNTKVIDGNYGYHYICHNITNRVLYASSNRITLIDTFLPLSGYKIAVLYWKIYGKKEDDWQSRINHCESNPKGTFSLELKTMEEEINNIHLKAVDGNQEDADDITERLRETDQKFLADSDRIFEQFDNKEISFETFNNEMERLLIETILRTEQALSPSIARRIYGDYNLANILQTTGSHEDGMPM